MVNLYQLIVLVLLGTIAVDAVQINIDTSRAPDLANFGNKVRGTLIDWFPRVSSLLNSPTFQPPSRIDVYFDPNYKGVAYAQGQRIVGSVDYYRKQQQDVGSMVHEMAHVIQGYRKCDGWITEGIADWVRYYHYEPNRKPSKPNSSNHWTNGYGVSAYFLNYINSRYNPMIYWINKDCREGTYDPSMFPRLTGKTIEQHWQDMLRSG